MKLELGPESAVSQRRASLWPWLALLFAGSAAMGAWFLIGPALGPGWYYSPGFGRGVYSYANQVLLLFVPYGMALWAWHRGARAPMWAILGGAVVLHVLVLFAPLPQSQDFYQYLFYGRMQAVHGVNPMVVSPSEFTGDPWYFWIRWYSQPSVYGPVWTMTSFAVVKATGESLAAAFVSLKLLILALDLAVMALIVKAWRGTADPDRASWGLFVYAWNPVVLITVPLAGSSDVALGAAFLGAMLARRRDRNLVATVLLTLAMLVKVYAGIGLLLHLVLLARERGRDTVVRHGAVAAVIAAAAYAPYWSGWRTFSGLINSFELTNVTLAGMVQQVLASGMDLVGLPAAEAVAEGMVRLGGGVLLVSAVVWAVRRLSDQESIWRGVVLVLAAYLYLTPWSLYWYVLGPLALVAALPVDRLTYPILVFSGVQIFTLRLRPTMLSNLVQTLVRYGAPVASYLMQGRSPVRVPRRMPVRLSPPRPVPRRAPAAE